MIDKDQTPLLGFILAGGESRRMGGTDKFMMNLGGKKLLDHIIDRLAPQVDALILNANRQKLQHTIEVVPDLIKDLGPLGGLYTALSLAKQRGYSKIITSPADTPFIPDDFVKRLLQHHECPIVVAESNGQIHPVLALWDVDLVDDVKRALDDGERKMKSWIANYSPAMVNWTGRDDPFFNINTPDDLVEAEMRLDATSL